MTTTAPPPPRRDTTAPVIARPWAAGAGLLGVVSALAAGDLVAGLLNPPASPFLAVGNQFIRLTPEWLKQFAIATFGTYDKVALLGGMAVVIALLGLAAGLGSRQSPAVGQVTIAQLREIAEVKMKDMNANDIDGAVRMLAGSARSMGLTVVEG